MVCSIPRFAEACAARIARLRKPADLSLGSGVRRIGEHDSMPLLADDALLGELIVGRETGCVRKGRKEGGENPERGGLIAPGTSSTSASTAGSDQRRLTRMRGSRRLAVRGLLLKSVHPLSLRVEIVHEMHVANGTRPGTKAKAVGNALGHSTVKMMR